VKVYGVFPSSCIHIASSQQIQFQWIRTRDSKTVVIPFILVGTYPTTDYATLGPSELQPPFTDDYIQKINFFFSFLHSSAGQVSDLIQYFNNLAKSCVYVIQSLFSILCYHIVKYGAPSPEVTEQFCRVPLVLLIHAS